MQYNFANFAILAKSQKNQTINKGVTGIFVKQHFWSGKILRYKNPKLKWTKQKEIGNPRNFTVAKLS